MQQGIKRLSKMLFSRKNDAQSVANGDRRRIEIGLRQCDIRRSWSLVDETTLFSYHSCCLSYAKFLVFYISAHTKRQFTTFAFRKVV